MPGPPLFPAFLPTSSMNTSSSLYAVQSMFVGGVMNLTGEGSKESAAYDDYH